MFQTTQQKRSLVSGMPSAGRGVCDIETDSRAAQQSMGQSGGASEDLFEKVPSGLRPAGQEGKDEPAMQALGESVTGRRHRGGQALKS